MSGRDSSQDNGSTVINQAVEGLSDVAGYLRIDPVPPLWRQLKGYSAEKLKADAIAGLMVAIITIPQALAFALVVGLPVGAVLTAAVIGSFFYSLWGGSRHLVFGPTNTISIILAGALAATLAIPLNAIQKVVMIGFMIGVLQLAAGFFKIGNLSHFISRTVVIAYSTAAGVLIGVSQLTNFLGISRSADLSLPGVAQHVFARLATLQFNTLAIEIGLGAMIAMAALRRWRPVLPEGLLVLGLAGGGTALYEYCVVHFALPQAWSISGLGIRLVRDVGEVSGSLPLFQGFPAAEALTFVSQVLSIAVAAAMLGTLETISIAQSLAARSGQRINPNQELMAAGLGNLFSSAFGAMACSASFLRSSVSFESKGVTQFAQILSGAFILIVVGLSAGLVNYIPVTVLAAYIILLAVRIARPPEGRIVRRATGSDALVYWVTLLATLFLKLDVAIYIGMGLSLVLFLRKAAAPSLVEYSFNDQGQLARLEDRKDRGNAAISIVHVEGELFFGAADLFQEQVRLLADDQNLRVVILRLKNARHLDATSVLSLLQLHDYLRSRDRHLLISGLGPDLERVLRRSGAIERLGRENLFPAEQNLTMSTKRALKRASELLHLAKGHSPELRVAYDSKRARELEQSAAMRREESTEIIDYQI
jgi:SulP family sulfate permease